MKLFKRFSIPLAVITLLASYSAHADGPASSQDPSPFHLDSSNLPDNARTTLKDAAEDFNRAVKGLKPLHAKVNAAMSDGGTVDYVGADYSITIFQKMAKIGNVAGSFYGPVVKVKGTWLQGGNDLQVSHVEFYSADQLKKLKGDN